MKSKAVRFVVLITVGELVAASAFAQKAANAADNAFIQLQAVALPIEPAPTPPGTKKTKEQFDNDRKLQSAGFLAAADKAHDFYTTYPTHEKAAEAKKIEVISMLRAVQTGAVEQEPKAMRMAKDYRADSSQPSFNRYNVAATVTQIEIRKKNITNHADLMAEYQKRAMDLYGEFPNEPAVMDMLVGVAKNADPDLARSIANQILTLPAPTSAKQAAQGVLDRLDMPGKSVAFEWQDENGKSYQISDFKGKAVVFYIWSSLSPSSEAASPLVSNAAKADVVLVSVNVDTSLDKGKGAKGRAGVAGISYFDSRGLDGPLPRQLRVIKVPSVCVVDANGVFVGYGPASELQSLLKKAGK